MVYRPFGLMANFKVEQRGIRPLCDIEKWFSRSYAQKYDSYVLPIIASEKIAGHPRYAHSSATK